MRFNPNAYSQITVDSDGMLLKPYRETPHPVRKVPGHGGNLVWNAEIGRWVVSR